MAFAAMSGVVCMKQLSIGLWYSPIACPISWIAVRKYGATAVPKRIPRTVPQTASFGIVQCDEIPAPSRGMLFESPP